MPYIRGQEVSTVRVWGFDFLAGIYCSRPCVSRIRTPRFLSACQTVPWSTPRCVPMVARD